MLLLSLPSSPIRHLERKPLESKDLREAMLLRSRPMLFYSLLRSDHPGLSASISAIFLLLRQPLSCFSPAIASPILSYNSK